MGRLLGEYMERRGISAEPDNVVALGERAGLDGKKLLRNVERGIPGRRHQNLARLADELGLSEQERTRLAMAFVFEHEPKR